MKILLLGGNGQVGHALRETLPVSGALVTSTRHGGDGDVACDLADPRAVSNLLDEVAAELIVNAAAYTAVDRAEAEADAAFALNASLPGLLGTWAARRGARVVHYSTDYVFDGSGERPYRENDPTQPLGVYGQTKLAGERALQASGCEYLILRTAWVYGSHGHNFLKTMLRLARERTILNVVDDQWGTPTSASWIAQATMTVLERWGLSEGGGIFHLTAAGKTTWHGFAVEIVSYAASRGLLSTVPEIKPLTSAEYPTPARRPQYSVLDGSLVEQRFGLERPEWRTLVHRILDRMHSYT